MATNAIIETYDRETLPNPSDQPLYAKREKIFPKRTTGWFRSLKWWIMAITLGIYYVTPWLRWDRGPYAPDQAVLVDLANRRFYFFFIEIWPHEFFYVAGLLVMAGIALFLVTSTLGRAWCGYTCPQTVWVDLFLAIERFFEGDRNAQMKLEASGWFERNKILKRLSKHVTWLIVAMATGGAWIFYFADAPTLFWQFFSGQAHYVAYSTVAILTATTYVFGGLLREQVCIYMCPWPRIQAAMLDDDSLVVTYNDWRGEPRTSHTKRNKNDAVPEGDCVSCNACVAVCPMGIDIREGQQLACITCALCIDACDNVMAKLGRQSGLISYATLDMYDQNMALATAGNVANDIDPGRVRNSDRTLSDKVREFDWRNIIRPRTMIYLGIYTLIGSAMFAALLMREQLDVNVLPDRNPVFVRLSDGSIRNGYQLKILNMKAEPRRFRVSAQGLPGSRLWVAGQANDDDVLDDVPVGPDVLRNIKIYVAVGKEMLSTQSTHFKFVVEETEGVEMSSVGARFEIPKDSMK